MVLVMTREVEELSKDDASEQEESKRQEDHIQISWVNIVANWCCGWYVRPLFSSRSDGHSAAVINTVLIAHAGQCHRSETESERLATTFSCVPIMRRYVCKQALVFSTGRKTEKL